MPLPYTAGPDTAGMARELSPIEGSFEYVHGVLTQTTVGKPVEWHYLGRSISPYAVVGDNTWRNYTVSARVVLPRSGTGGSPPGAALIARFQGFRKTTVSNFRATSSRSVATATGSSRRAAHRRRRWPRAGSPPGTTTA